VEKVFEKFEKIKRFLFKNFFEGKKFDVKEAH